MIGKTALPLIVLAAATALTSAPAAQTTHTVDVGPFFDFGPVDLCIQTGDTVQWVWQGAFLHNVESGVGGIHDGIFRSGAPVVGPASFSLTFDAAFLAAQPVAGNVYDYFCIVHVGLGMVGKIVVQIPPSVTGFNGTGINPTPSLTLSSGTAVIGQAFTVLVDNPLGTQSAGSLAFLAAGLSQASLPVPGFGMASPGAVGEFLIPIAPPPILTLGPAPWSPGTPAPIPVGLPPNAGLVGVTVFLQGLVLDPVGPNRFGLTEGLAVTIGNC